MLRLLGGGATVLVTMIGFGVVRFGVGDAFFGVGFFDVGFVVGEFEALVGTDGVGAGIVTMRTLGL